MRKAPYLPCCCCCWRGCCSGVVQFRAKCPLPPHLKHEAPGMGWLWLAQAALMWPLPPHS